MSAHKHIFTTISDGLYTNLKKVLNNSGSRNECMFFINNVIYIIRL